jgi:hypothetical protein
LIAIGFGGPEPATLLPDLGIDRKRTISVTTAGVPLLSSVLSTPFRLGAPANLRRRICRAAVERQFPLLQLLADREGYLCTRSLMASGSGRWHWGHALRHFTPA